MAVSASPFIPVETIRAGDAGHSLFGDSDQDPPDLMLGQELHGIQIVGLLGRLQIHGLLKGGNGAPQPVPSRMTVTQQVVDRAGALVALDRLQQSSAGCGRSCWIETA